MTAAIRTVHWGVGAMGSACLREALVAATLDVRAVVGQRPREEVAQAVADAVSGLDGGGCEHAIAGDGALEDAVAEAGGANVLILAADAAFPELGEQVLRGIRLGLSVVCIAEQMIGPAAFDAAVADRILAEALDAGVAVVGTGVNPGFAMDVLPAVLSAPMRSWTSLRVRRVHDLSHYGPTVLDDMGIGREVDDFERALATRRVDGHRGFAASIAVVAERLAIGLQIEDESRRPLIRSVPTPVGAGEIPSGRVIGIEQRCSAVSADGRRVVLEHPQRLGTLAGEERPTDVLVLDGDPPVHMEIRAGLAGGPATVALMLNAVHGAFAARPGLHTIGTLPIAPLARARAGMLATAGATP